MSLDSWKFHLLVVPAAAISAAVVAATAPDGTVVFSVSFLVVAGFMALIPIVRSRLDKLAVRIGRPQLFTPAQGVPVHEMQLRGFHVFLYTMYGTTSLLRPSHALSAVLLFLDTALSAFVYMYTKNTASSTVLAATDEIVEKPNREETCAWLCGLTRNI